MTNKPRIEIRGKMSPGYESILTDEALGFVARLASDHSRTVHDLLERRNAAQARFDRGETPDFLASTQNVRESDWTVAPLPEDLLDRRVEITGPVDRKMVINALNSGAKTFMADFEDSNAPSWSNCVEGQINLRDAVAGTIELNVPETGKQYKLNEKHAVLIVRPRGWHLFEKHMLVDGEPVPAGIFDFGLYFFHNVKALLAKGSGPYFYLPKMQSHLEARLWNSIFVDAQDALGIPQGTIKGTVLIETLPASFEMDEILYELKEHSSGLNCGRWDYIFSYIKTLREHADKVVPDRAQVGMTQPCMRNYSQLVIKTCHRRGVHAMGGMAAQIPIKSDPEANQAALDKVKADKLREATDGHDGTWVAHPGLVPIAMEVFDAEMKDANQIASKKREDVSVSREDLLVVPTGTRTESGLRQNINVGVQYLAAWIGGNGCVPLYNLMEDAATAEISRTQIWQWVRHGVTLEDGRKVSRELVNEILEDEMSKLAGTLGEAFDAKRFDEAKELFRKVSLEDTCADFLTLPAYEILTRD